MRLLALAAVLLLARQDEKITLKFAPKQGDKISRSKKMALKIAMKFETEEQVQDAELEQREIGEETIEYAGVENGKVTRKVIACAEGYRETRQTPKVEWQRMDLPLRGRKVTISMKDGQVIRDGAEGLAEKELQKLPLEDTTTRFFPPSPVAVGESWTVKEEDALAFLESEMKIKTAAMKVKVDSVKEIDRRRCAILKATINLTATGINDIEVTAAFDADIVVWIERGYVLEAKAKGKMALKLKNERVAMTGQGDIEMEMKAKVE